MAPGDGPSDDQVDVSCDPANGEAADAPPVRRRTDPAVDGTWLRYRSLPPRRGRPRASTLVLVAAFVGVLVLYILVHPAG